MALISGSYPTISAIAVIASLFGTSISFAADLPARPYTKAPPLYPAPPSWTGCYIGGNIGAGWDDTHSGGVALAGVPQPFQDFGGSTGSGFVGGGQIGCDYQFSSHWVVGIQGKAEFGTINSSNPVAAFPGVTAAYQMKNTETLTARIGYAFSPSVLAYVKGGAAWTNAKAAAFVGPVAGESADFSMSGYTVGGGLEWMFAPGWSVFSEYNYMDFGTRDVNLYATGLLVPAFGAAGALSDTIAMRIRSQEVIFGVNYKFNFASPVAARY
jgi:outer membrane immunogenic protein